MHSAPTTVTNLKEYLKRYSDSDYGLLLFGRKRCINKYWRQKMLSSQRKRPIKKSVFFVYSQSVKQSFLKRRNLPTAPFFDSQVICLHVDEKPNHIGKTCACKVYQHIIFFSFIFIFYWLHFCKQPVKTTTRWQAGTVWWEWVLPSPVSSLKLSCFTVSTRVTYVTMVFFAYFYQLN